VRGYGGSNKSLSVERYPVREEQLLQPLHFARLIGAGLASAVQKSNNNWQIVTYTVNISDKGRLLVAAWKQGDRTRLKAIMGGPVPGQTSA